MANEIEDVGATPNSPAYQRLACGFLGGAITAILVCFLECLLFAVANSGTGESRASLLPILVLVVVAGMLGMASEAVVVFRESRRKTAHWGWRWLLGRRVSGAWVWVLGGTLPPLLFLLMLPIAFEQKTMVLMAIPENVPIAAFLGYISSMVSLQMRYRILKEPRETAGDSARALEDDVKRGGSSSLHD